MRGSRAGMVITLAGFALLSACSASEEKPAAASPAPAAAAAPSAAAASVDAVAEARKIFSERCATCHGPSGAGDGPASAGLTPKPRNLRDAAWQQSVADVYLEQIIQYGGAAVGRSPAMPANPDLTSKPEVVAALREHLRALAH